MLGTLFVVATAACVGRAVVGIARARRDVRRFEAEIEAEARLHSGNEQTPREDQEIHENPLHAVAFSASLMSAAKVHAETSSVQPETCPEHSNPVLEVDQPVVQRAP